MNGQAEMFNPLDGDPMDLIEHMGDRVPPQHQWPPLLADLFAVLEAYNIRHGMSPADAAVDARDRCVLLADYFGGRMVYLPTGERLHAALRDAIIWREFKGNNHVQLADKYELTITRIYQILAEQKALAVKERQGKLFQEG